MKNKEIEEILGDVKRHLDYVNVSGLKSIRDIEMEKMYYYILDLENNRDKALKIIDSYDLGKFDYSIPAGGIIELRDVLKGDSE